MIALVRWSMRAGSVGLGYGAVSYLEQSKYGEALVDAGLCLLYVLVASSDLHKIWSLRKMNALVVAQADPPTMKFMSGALLFYILFIGGVLVQFFE